MSVKSEIGYARKLVGAGLSGIASAWEKSGDRVVEPITAGKIWVPAGIGAATGLIGVCLHRSRRSPSSFAIAGLLGSILGFSAVMAWSSREFSGTAVRTARDQVNTVRDARWLERNPIDYA